MNTLFRGHAVLPFQRVKERLGAALIKLPGKFLIVALGVTIEFSFPKVVSRTTWAMLAFSSIQNPKLKTIIVLNHLYFQS